MDGMHLHRLAVLWPDVYPRLLRVMDADAMFQDRIVSRDERSLINSATTQAQAVDGGIPNPVRMIWLTRGGDRDPSPQQWAEYDAAAKDFNTVTSIFRPGSSARPIRATPLRSWRGTGRIGWWRAPLSSSAGGPHARSLFPICAMPRPPPATSISGT